MQSTVWIELIFDILYKGPNKEEIKSTKEEDTLYWTSLVQ